MSQRAIFALRANLRHLAGVAFFFVLIALVAVSAASGAGSKRSYAGFVLDAKTGNTLYSYAADSARYPASVTKVMTLYILFQELKAGRMTLRTRLDVSRYAASAVPTKLGLRVGSTIRVEDAIKALVTASANDVARVIAENISGSETRFAQRMTATARSLGMSRTTYANASGLPNSRQITTVRDQARLGAAIFQHFPDYYKYFQTRSFTYAGRTYGNHNRLLGRNGVDGIKTGYISASGYNLLTAARINERHIIVVGFGFDSGAARNAKVAELVSRYLPRARRGSYWRQAMIPQIGASGSSNVFGVAQNQPVVPLPRLASRLPGPELDLDLEPAPAELVPATQDADIQVAALSGQIQPATPVRPVPLPVQPAPLPVQPAPPPVQPAPPPVRPVLVAVIEAPTQLIPATAVQATTRIAGVPAPRNPPSDVLGAWISETFQLGPRTGDRVQPGRAISLIPPATIGVSSAEAIDLMTSGAIGNNQTQPVASSSWVVQIGAPASAQAAEQMLDNATRRISALVDLRSYVEQFEKTGQVFYRARFSGFARRAEAVSMCEQIKQNNISCLAVQS